MNGFRAFFKKEMMEGIRTYKLWVMLIIFCVFGIMSPFFAKLTPEILKSLAGDGIQITINDPTALDSFTQFFKNVSQMGSVVLLIIFNGNLTNEIHKGTLIPVLTKGLSRNAVILAKFMYIVVVWTLCYICSFAITYLYTMMVFPQMEIVNLFFSMGCLWIFGCFLIGVSFSASAFVRGNYGGLLITILVIGMLFIANIIPSVHDYNPVSLMNDNVAILDIKYQISSLYPAIIVSVAAIALLLGLALSTFRKKQL